MWVIASMEVLFAGGMLALTSDILGSRYEKVKKYAPGVVATSAIAIALFLLLSEWSAYRGQIVQVQPVSSFFASLYVVDRFSTFAALTAMVIGLIVAVFSFRLVDHPGHPGQFYALLLILICSLVGVVSSGDLVTLFLFWEAMSISAYGLVGFGRSQLSMEASLKYFLMAGVGSVLALYGISAIYAATGSMQLGTVSTLFYQGSVFGELGLAILIVGLGVEAAVVPVHTWLPDVYSATTLPSASIISGAVTGIGVFALLKVLQPLVPGGGFEVPPFGRLSGLASLQFLLAGLALLTMLVGNLSALAQTNLRRLLSFSSVAQTGYMLAALSTLSVSGLVAAVFTIWNHGLLKCTFFMIIGKGNSNFEAADLDNLRGTGRSNRLLGFLYGSSSLGMMGAPPFGMFWSEVLIVQSLLLASTALFFWIAVAVVVNIVLSIGYYFRVINTVVFGQASATEAKASVAELVPPMSLLGLSLLTGLLPFALLAQLL